MRMLKDLGIKARFRRYEFPKVYTEQDFILMGKTTQDYDEYIDNLKKFAQAFMDQGKYTRKVEMENNELD